MDGISVEGREIVRQAFQSLARYLAGGLEIGGATIQGGPTLVVHATLERDAVKVWINGPRPKVTKTVGPLSFTGELIGATVRGDAATVEISGLPDVTINLM